MKDETYPEYKHARAINSRSDEFKCAVGPIFRLIEKQVFKHRAFIKRVPVSDRPRTILESLYRVGAVYVATDYTAFESLFVKLIMESCEFELYDYMTQYLSDGENFMRLLHVVLGGENICDFKTFTTYLEATRMSGEMCTSLGNGFSNLMFMLFMAEEKGCTCVEGKVEGDDGLFAMLGPPPTTEDFARLGLIIKLEVHHDLETASFCGLVFDREDCVNVTDPREVLATFGWTANKYLKARSSKKFALLRCKALSLAHQYPGCPIIVALARCALRVTRSVDVRNLVYNWRNTYEREQLIAAFESNVVFVEPPKRTRHLVEKLYRIPIEHQFAIEAYLDSVVALGPLEHHLIDLHMSPVWKHYWHSYSSTEVTRTPDQQWVQCPAYKLTLPFGQFKGKNVKTRSQ
jgi:hypothetical protein